MIRILLLMAMLIILALFPASTNSQDYRYVIDNACITHIDTDHAYLAGPDLDHMVVYGLKVHYKGGCERIEVLQK